MALTEAISKPGRTETRPIPHIQQPWHALCSLFWKQNAREEGEEASRGNLECFFLFSGNNPSHFLIIFLLPNFLKERSPCSDRLLL